MSEDSDLDVVDDVLDVPRKAWVATHEVHLSSIGLPRRVRVRTFRCDVEDGPVIRHHVRRILQDNPGFRVVKVLIDLNS